jgi:anthranilate phosphoribosyltransferase
MDNKTTIGIVGIVSLTAVEICALMKGYDGTFLTATIGTIAAIVGGIVGFKVAIKGSE